MRMLFTGENVRAPRFMCFWNGPPGHFNAHACLTIHSVLHGLMLTNRKQWQWDQAFNGVLCRPNSARFGYYRSTLRLGRYWQRWQIRKKVLLAYAVDGNRILKSTYPRWHHDMVLLVACTGNSPVVFSAQMPIMQKFDSFRSKQPTGWWNWRWYDAILRFRKMLILSPISFFSPHNYSLSPHYSTLNQNVSAILSVANPSVCLIGTIPSSGG